MNYRDRILIKFCLIGFFLSFLFSFYIEKNYEHNFTNISNIDFNYINSYVKVFGNIKSQNLIENKNILFFEICENENLCIKNVIFNFDKNIKFNEKLNYSILGKVNFYNNNLSIIALEIKVLN